MVMEGERHTSTGMGLFLDDSALTAAAAGELTAPLALLRQLGLAVGAEAITDDERQLLAHRMTLTSERALRLTASLGMALPQQQSLPLEPVNPMSVCQEVVRELSPLFQAYDKRIIVQARQRTPLLVANRMVLRRILLAFGDNALHYTMANHPIILSITGRGDRVRIGVRDYGPAVPVDIWQRLEGRLARQASAPLSSRPQTSGIGLLAAKRLAELMNSIVGTVRHRDGVTFYVDIRLSGQLSLL